MSRATAVSRRFDSASAAATTSAGCGGGVVTYSTKLAHLLRGAHGLVVVVIPLQLVEHSLSAVVALRLGGGPLAFQFEHLRRAFDVGLQRRADGGELLPRVVRLEPMRLHVGLRGFELRLGGGQAGLVTFELAAQRQSLLAGTLNLIVQRFDPTHDRRQSAAFVG